MLATLGFLIVKTLTMYSHYYIEKCMVKHSIELRSAARIT